MDIPVSRVALALLVTVGCGGDASDLTIPDASPPDASPPDAEPSQTLEVSGPRGGEYIAEGYGLQLYTVYTCLDTIESQSWHVEVYAHLSGCGSCQLLLRLNLVAEESRAYLPAGVYAVGLEEPAYVYLAWVEHADRGEVTLLEPFEIRFPTDAEVVEDVTSASALHVRIDAQGQQMAVNGEVRLQHLPKWDSHDGSVCSAVRIAGTATSPADAR